MSKIKLNLENDLHGLGAWEVAESITFDVFDSRLKHVASLSARSSETGELKPGAYKITAQLPSGDEWQDLIYLDDSPADVNFRLSMAEREADSVGEGVQTFGSNGRSLLRPGEGYGAGLVPFDWNGDLRRAVRGASFRKSVRMVWDRLIAEAGGEDQLEPKAQLMAVDDADLIDRARDSLEFVGNGSDRIPVARFEVADAILHVALPIANDTDTCTVYVGSELIGPAGGVRIEVSEYRPMVRSMLNLIDAGRTHQAANLAKDARELLREKYADPIGATLGAYLLYQLGRLEQEPLAGWADNLMTNPRFSWIPDTQILKVALNTSRGEFNPDDYETLIQCSKKPVLFTVAYSMMVSSLRSWRGELSDAHQEEGRKALAGLAAQNTRIDWSAPTVVVRAARSDKG